MSSSTSAGAHGQVSIEERRQSSISPSVKNSWSTSTAPNQSGLNTMPDLRFLNWNSPMPNASSILDPTSKNSAGIQQFQALKDAESWYERTSMLLKERLALCEKLRDGLGELNGLLSSIEAMGQRSNMEEENLKDVRSQIEAIVRTEIEFGVDNASDFPRAYAIGRSPSQPLGVDTRLIMSAGDIEADLGGKEKHPDQLTNIDQGVSGVEADLKQMEDAVQAWLREIRVCRAKWIAGGRSVNKRTGVQ